MWLHRLMRLSDIPAETIPNRTYYSLGIDKQAAYRPRTSHFVSIFEFACFQRMIKGNTVVESSSFQILEKSNEFGANKRSSQV